MRRRRGRRRARGGAGTARGAGGELSATDRPPPTPGDEAASFGSAPSPTRIRAARADDLAALTSLEAAFGGDGLTRRQLRYLLTRAHADAWVAVDDDDHVLGDAVVLYRRGFDSARLYSLVVAPEARGTGLGAALLRAAEERAAERGCVSLRLEVREDAASARRLYARRGFIETARTPGYYHDGVTALRMRKRISGAPPRLLSVPYAPQSLPFTCGPACLRMAFAHLDGATLVASVDRSADDEARLEELELWRVATTVYLAAGHGGCSPHGLAVAATRRGYAVEVRVRDAGVPFLESVRSEEKREVIRLAHRGFVRELERRQVPLRTGPVGLDAVEEALARGWVPIVLVSGSRLYRERVPHWVVVTGVDATHVYLHDPWWPDGTGRADAIHLPLRREAFTAVASYGRSRQRALVTIGPRVPRRAHQAGQIDGSPAR